MSKRDEGTSVVEFTFVVIPLLLIVFGMVDFGRAYYTQISLDHAAREGVRVAALGDEPDVSAMLGGLADAAVLDPPPETCPNADGEARVVVSSEFEFITPVAAIADILPGTPPIPTSMTLSGVGVAKCYE